MARQQFLKTYASVTFASAGTGYQLTGTQKFCCSIIIQALPTNTDFVFVGDINRQLLSLAPGKSIEIHGDNLDNGTEAFIDISTLYGKANVNGEGLSFMTLDGQ